MEQASFLGGDWSIRSDGNGNALAAVQATGDSGSGNSGSGDRGITNATKLNGFWDDFKLGMNVNVKRVASCQLQVASSF